MEGLSNTIAVFRERDERLGLALACGIFLLGAHWGWFPQPQTWAIQIAWVGLILFGSLWSVKVLNAVFQAFEVLVLWTKK